METNLITALKAATAAANSEGPEMAVRATRQDRDIALSHVNEAIQALTVLRDRLTRPSDPNERAKSIVDQVTRDD